MITSRELRDKWKNFWEEKGHVVVPSASLVPETDASVLFTMAGMHPLVPYLMGQTHPQGTRIANAQKCVRTGDIDEVGDETHLTFFEMLGNWSLGDFGKEEQIKWSFEFLTDKKWLGLPLDRLAISVFAGDESAPRDEKSAETWLSLGVPKDRIAYLPKEKNFWSAGSTGPCGPDTEMFYWIDDGSTPPENFQETNDDPRWVEIWNDVIMEYERLEDGTLKELPQKNIDTGMGLERVVAALNGHRGIYDTDLFTSMWEVIGLSQEVMSNDEVKKARIILDHIRASTFIACDGVIPSNKDRGYVLRRLLRRAMVMGRILSLRPHWLDALIGKVVEEYSYAYPELMERSSEIFKVILDEQSKFSKTLDKGMKEYEKLITKNNTITGDDAFNLYQTFGFPLEITHELAVMAGIVVDRAEFENKFNAHKESSRTANKGEFKGGLANSSWKTTQYHTVTHLMHQALREVLGDHVYQRGSNITEERTRFDFNYDSKLTPEQIAQIETKVNQWIKDDLTVTNEKVPLSEAYDRKAIGLFGEKYADIVSIYVMTNKNTDKVVSIEFCGGPHVEHTAQVEGVFKITKEETASANIRRIRGELLL